MRKRQRQPRGSPGSGGQVVDSARRIRHRSTSNRGHSVDAADEQSITMRLGEVSTHRVNSYDIEA